MKRLQGVSISGEAIGAIIATCEHVPLSAVFRKAYFDHARSVFVCVFEDDSFDEVPEGSAIPIDVESSGCLITRKEFTVVWKDEES